MSLFRRSHQHLWRDLTTCTTNHKLTGGPTAGASPTLPARGPWAGVARAEPDGPLASLSTTAPQSAFAPAPPTTLNAPRSMTAAGPTSRAPPSFEIFSRSRPWQRQALHCLSCLNCSTNHSRLARSHRCSRRAATAALDAKAPKLCASRAVPAADLQARMPPRARAGHAR
eukprot:15433566-Alexandrium_andersonii.AAC.1